MTIHASFLEHNSMMRLSQPQQGNRISGTGLTANISLMVVKCFYAMKPKLLSLFFLLGMLESLSLLLLEITSPSSAESNALFAGLSGPRLVIAAFLLLSTLTFGGFWCLARFSPSLLQNISQKLDARLSQPDNLLAVSFYALLAVLAVPALSVPGIWLGCGQIIKRAAQPLFWVEGLAVTFLVMLVIGYQPVYRQPGFFDNAIRRIGRASFINRSGFWLVCGLLALGALLLVLVSPLSMGRTPSHDSGIFLYFGQQILRGKIPFLDLWDHKPPLIFYTDALGLLIGRGSPWGVWGLEYLSLSASILIGFLVLRRYYRDFPAAFGVCAGLGGLVFLLEGGNLTEEYSLPLQWAVLGLFALSERKGWGGRAGALRAFGAGALFSLALNFKQTSVGIWLALILWSGLSLMAAPRQNMKPGKRFAWACFGAASILGGIAGYFAVHQGLLEFWRVAYQYNLIYSNITLEERIRALADMADFFTRTTPLFPMVFIVWGAGVWQTLRKGLQQEAALSFPLAVAIIDLPIELVLTSLSGENYRHYFITLLPAMMILTAWGISQFDRYLLRFPTWQKVFWALLLVVFLFSPSVQSLWSMRKPSEELTISETVKIIQEETQPGDYVLVWGSQTVVNFLSDRPAPTRFVHQKALFRAGFANPALSAEILHDLQTRTPRMIINTHLPSTPFIKETGGVCHLPPDPPEGMDAVFDFICHNYQLDRVITKDQWEIYKLEQP